VLVVLPSESEGGRGDSSESLELLAIGGMRTISGAGPWDFWGVDSNLADACRNMLVSDLVWDRSGRSGEFSVLFLLLPLKFIATASRMGEEGMGILSMSEMVRCFKIGFLPDALTRPTRSSVDAILGGGTGSAAV
jgi:hypothetical protein